MTELSPPAKQKFTVAQWLIIIIASIGFLFDTYELLMTPLTAPPAIAELLNVPVSHPLVAHWTGALLWISALCGGFFGLLGGWMVDKLGRKTIMAVSIFIYSASPFAAAYSTSLEAFITFRSLTFVGVCIEFVAAITWIAEVFDDRKTRARWLGITQAFASLGGIAVTYIGFAVESLAKSNSLPHLGLPQGPISTDPSTWRYHLMTGILPAIPIALMLPFVPESAAWKARRASGTLKRPSFAELFSPKLRRTTIIAAALSACAYGIAFGALQLTPRLVTPGLPEAADTDPLGPLPEVVAKLDAAAKAAVPGSPESAAAKGQAKFAHKLLDKQAQLPALAAAVKIAPAGSPERVDAEKKLADVKKDLNLRAHAEALNAEFDKTQPGTPERKVVLGKMKVIKEIQDPHTSKVKEMGLTVQAFQENGGLLGRIVLAILIMLALSHGTLLRIFQIPALAALPITYFILFKDGGSSFFWMYGLCGFLTVAQFSYFGEYLPKAFPLHLRGTGASFATNVGGRMIGTSMSVVTTQLVAPMIAAGPVTTPADMAHACGYVATAIALLALILGFLLPRPQEEDVVEGIPATRADPALPAA